MTIGIIGGGIAGLATAIALAKTGKSVDVYEKSAQFREVGAGLQIGPNAVSALKQLGAFETLEPTTFAPANIRIFDGQSGTLLSTLPLGSKFENRFGQPYRVSHRADLLAALLATARKYSTIKLHLGSQLSHLDLHDGGATCHFTGSPNADHHMIVGADGFRSAVRRNVLNDGPPVFAGHSLYRALVPISQTPDIPHPNDVQLWLYPKGHVVHYPVSSGTKLNIIAASEQHWETKNWSTPAEPDEIATCFANSCEDLQVVLMAPKSWSKWAAAGHPHSSTWHKNNVVLLGDAIHPTLPYLAQGAAMALEDAVCLAAALQPGKKISGFVEMRRARTRKIVDLSRHLGKVYHLTNPLRLARNAVISRTSTNAQYNRLSWLYNWTAPDI